MSSVAPKCGAPATRSRAASEGASPDHGDTKGIAGRAQN